MRYSYRPHYPPRDPDLLATLPRCGAPGCHARAHACPLPQRNAPPAIVLCPEHRRRWCND